MRSGPTYYDFFGVSPSASAEQIRSAYLWLMKQHHPDLNGHSDNGRDADFAAVLNRSYDVLKDPAKRARYDQFLVSESRTWRKARARRRPLLTGQAARRRQSKWDSSSKAAAALAVAIVVLIGAAVWGPEVPGLRSNEAASAAVVYAPPVARIRAAAAESPLDDGFAVDEPLQADARVDVRRAMSATPQEAQAESERCFASARRSGNSALAERCVLFDDAYVEWNQTSSNPAYQPDYFRGSAVRFRHSSAMAAAGLGVEQLDELRQAALKTLLEEIRTEMNARATRGSLADPENTDFAPYLSQ